MTTKQEALDALEELYGKALEFHGLDTEKQYKAVRDFIEGRDKLEKVDKNGLKPCPFCGGKATREVTICDDLIRCDWCKAEIKRRANNGHFVYIDPAYTWNTRVDNTAKAVEKLKGE